MKFLETKLSLNLEWLPVSFGYSQIKGACEKDHQYGSFCGMRFVLGYFTWYIPNHIYPYSKSHHIHTFYG